MFESIKNKIAESTLNNWKNKAQFLSSDKLIDFYLNSKQDIINNEEIIQIVFDKLNENDYLKLPIDIQEKFYLMNNDKLIFLSDSLIEKYF